MLRVVSHQAADHQDAARDDEDPAKPLNQAGGAPARPCQADKADHAEHDREPARAREREQEPGHRGDHDLQIDAAEPAARVAREKTRLHHVVGERDQPAADADHDPDPAVRLRDDDERQDGGHDDRMR